MTTLRLLLTVTRDSMLSLLLVTVKLCKSHAIAFFSGLPKHTGLSIFAGICNSNVVSINSFNFQVLMLQLE